MIIFKLMIALFIFSVTSFSYIDINPIGFDKNIENGSEVEYLLRNYTAEPIMYRVQIREMKREGIKDMSKLIKLSSKIIYLKPSEEKILKVCVSSPEIKKVGDYGAYLNIEQIDDRIKNVNSGAKLGVTVDFTMGIFAYIGKKNSEIYIKNIKLYEKNGKRWMRGKLKNPNERLERILISAIDESGKKYLVGTFRFFAQESRELDKELIDIPENIRIKKFGVDSILKD